MTPTTRAALNHLHGQLEAQLAAKRDEIGSLLDRLSVARAEEVQLASTVADIARDVAPAAEAAA